MPHFTVVFSRAQWSWNYPTWCMSKMQRLWITSTTSRKYGWTGYIRECYTVEDGVHLRHHHFWVISSFLQTLVLAHVRHFGTSKNWLNACLDWIWSREKFSQPLLPPNQSFSMAGVVLQQRRTNSMVTGETPRREPQGSTVVRGYRLVSWRDLRNEYGVDMVHWYYVFLLSKCSIIVLYSTCQMFFFLSRKYDFLFITGQGPNHTITIGPTRQSLE